MSNVKKVAFDFGHWTLNFGLTFNPPLFFSYTVSRISGVRFLTA
jgi:hypothetical protein